MKFVLVMVLSLVMQEHKGGYKSEGLGIGAAVSIHSIEFTSESKCEEAKKSIKWLVPYGSEFKAECIEK